MSIIEGVGDEVTVVAVVMLILVLLLTVLNARNVMSSFNVAMLNWRIFAQQPQPSEVESEVRPVETANRDSISEESNQNAHVETNALDEGVTSLEAQANSSDDMSAPHSSADGGNEESSSQSDSALPDMEETVPQDSHDVPQEEGPLPLNIIRVRLKYLNDTERTVTTDRTVKVKEFKRNHFAEDIANDRTVRLIFNGQLLQDNRTIAESSISDGAVVHVHVSHTPADQPIVSDSDYFDLSNFFWPLFAVMLGVCWVTYIQYPHYFNVPSIVLLIVFTVSFLIVCTHSSVEAS